MTASKTEERTTLGRIPTNCSRMVLRVEVRPAESAPDEVRQLYPSGIPPEASTVVKHASRLAVVLASRSDCERLAAAKADSSAFWMLRAAAEASESLV